MELDGSVFIRSRPRQVFDCWAALERSPEHQKPTKERTRITDGVLGIGTRFRAVDRYPGRTVRFEMEITDYQPPERMSALWEEPMSGSWDATFRAEGDGTRMTFHTIIEPTGWMGAVTPLLRPWASRQLAQGLDSFRDWVESGRCGRQ